MCTRLCIKQMQRSLNIYNPTIVFQYDTYGSPANEFDPFTITVASLTGLFIASKREKPLTCFLKWFDPFVREEFEYTVVIAATK